jgi:hypothetical protein
MQIPAVARISEGQTIELRAASPGDGTQTDKREFTMQAYTGAPVQTIFGAMIVDLEGMKVGRQKKPIDRDHDPLRIVGYSESIKKSDGGLLIDGRVIEKMEAGREVALAADEGFPWQASMKFNIDKVEELDEGESRTVNGRKFSDGMVVTKSRLLGACFCPYGADADTSSIVLGENVDGLVEVESSKETDMAEKTKSEAALSANDVAKLKAEAADGAVEKERGKLAALKTAFPDRLEFAVEQFEKDHTVEQAKAELCDVVVKEQATDKEKIAALEKDKAELSRKVDAYTTDGHTGVTTKLGSDDKPDTSKMNPEQLARHNWENDVDGCKAQFSGNFEVYEMFLVNEARIRETATHIS